MFRTGNVSSADIGKTIMNYAGELIVSRVNSSTPIGYISGISRSDIFGEKFRIFLFGDHSGDVIHRTFVDVFRNSGPTDRTKK